MRAFSSGCAALTGIEAISDSVMAFKPTEWKNARRVLTVMVLLLAVMFGGMSVLAQQLGTIYEENGPTLLYQLGDQVFGHNSPMVLVLQVATLLILLLAANTAYADFPAWPTSWPKTVTSPASSRPWAIGWCLATGSWPSVALPGC